jgi:calpain
MSQTIISSNLKNGSSTNGSSNGVPGVKKPAKTPSAIQVKQLPCVITNNTTVNEAPKGQVREKSEPQDYLALREQYFAAKKLFEDSELPAVQSSISHTGRISQPFNWLRPKAVARNPKFFVEGYSRFDVRQGRIGNCWFLAALANLTQNEKYFKEVVPSDNTFDENYAGIFRFRFWQYGKWVDVVIDDRLPTFGGRLVFLSSIEKNEFWGALLEKAYAKLHGSYETLMGGTASEAMSDFTGELQ